MRWGNSSMVNSKVCCGWWLCSSAARPACDAHLVALAERTLMLTLLSLCCAGQVRVVCVQRCCAGGCYATWLVGCFCSSLQCLVCEWCR